MGNETRLLAPHSYRPLPFFPRHPISLSLPRTYSPVVAPLSSVGLLRHPFSVEASFVSVGAFPVVHDYYTRNTISLASLGAWEQVPFYVPDAFVKARLFYRRFRAQFVHLFFCPG